MKEIFIGFAFDEAKEKELFSISKGAVQIAANKYQQGFLKGLGTNPYVISVLPLGYYPKRSKKLFFHREIRTTNFATFLYLPMINIPFIRDYCIKRKLKKELNYFFVTNEGQITIYVYSLFLPFLKVLEYFKTKCAYKFKFALIVPDLPGKYGVVRKFWSFGGIKDRITSRPKMELSKLADFYIFLTESMKELFPDKPYAVIEGFLPEANYNLKQTRVPRSILYTGSLNPSFGIKKLIEAFSLIKDDSFSLWICGANGDQKFVELAATNDKRIKYYGFLQRDEIIKLQSKCDVLINPRSNTGLYTKYSFPSKTMEYLLSGSKVVMYKLQGVPEEYYEYIYIIEGEKPGDIRNAIITAVDDADFYKQKSRKQSNWIKKNKSTSCQIAIMKERFKE